MMMTGDHPRSNPTVQIPSWDHHFVEDPTAHIQSPISAALSSQYDAALAALQRYLPGNRDDEVVPAFDDFDDAFSCDDFRMFEFKVRKCAVARSHDWTDCPFAHPGEKARRRDPRRHHYSGSSCPDFRRGGDCARGDACEYAHGVFESWLHPARYRTQPCKDGTHCRRRICFFAHTPDQLRVLPLTTSPDASPSRLGHDSPFGAFGSPPSPTAGSPPISPSGSMSVNSVTESMRCLQLSKMKMGMGLSMSPPSWGLGLGLGSPRSPRPGFMSLPSTPIRTQTRAGLGAFDAWGGGSCEEEPVMERVESGQQLRERLYAKLVRENSLDRGGRANPASPDFG